MAEDEQVSEKKLLTAALLAFFFGVFGLHRFYVGKVGTGILMLLTFGGFTIWSWIDFIFIICEKFKDKNGLFLKK